MNYINEALADLAIYESFLKTAEPFIAKPPQNNYRFNEKLGWPQEVDTQLQSLLSAHEGQPLNFSQHVYDQANRLDGKHGVHPSTIPNLNGKFPSRNNGAYPVELEHNGRDITKLIMRHPYDNNMDAVMPILPSSGIQPAKATTIWTNSKNDKHKSLDLNTVHTPEEFQMGKAAKRKVVTSKETNAIPNYKPVSHDNPNALKVIKDRFLHPQIEEAVA
jgi:hypothetical protein